MRRSLPQRRLLARVRPALRAPLPLLGLVAAVGPLALSAGSEPAPDAHPAETAYHALPALPTGSSDAGRDGVEDSAIALAASLGAVPVDALGGACPGGELTVRWSAPAGGEFTAGAFVPPIGPEPTATTTEVNGIVVCGSHDHAFMGFEARFTGGRWDVVDVPYVGEEDEEHLSVQPAPAIPAGPKPVPVLAAPGTVTGPIEGYAAYEPQRTCDPTAKVGTRSLAGALLRDYAGSRNLGIVRGCSVGGRSEHKEGRAFDWGVNVSNPNEKAAAESFVDALMATDDAGNRHALARRMGIMYVIFDRQIWSSYRAAEGWRPYTGASPHRDHVHISMSWAGAAARTSFWSGTVPPDLPTASPNTSTVASSRRWTSGGGGAQDVSSGAERTGRGDRGSRGASLSPDELAAGVAALWSGEQPPSAGAIQAWLVSEGVSQEWAQQYADRAGHRAQRRAARDGGRGDDRIDDADAADGDGTGDEVQQRRDEREADRAARDERRREERAARDAEEERRREEWERRRADERAAREAEEQRRRDERAAREAEAEAAREARSGDGRRGRGGRGGWGSPTTTAPPPTTTTPPTTTPPTTTPAPTTTTAAPEATTTTAAPETTTTTAGG